jgi:hypothetical protein
MKTAAFLTRDGIVLYAPKQYDCRPGCGNTVRTDTRTRLLRGRAAELDNPVAYAASPVTRRLKPTPTSSGPRPTLMTSRLDPPRP